MQSSPPLQRALILCEQGRHDLAEKELRQHLAQSPRDAFPLSLLSVCLLEQEKRDEAEQAAQEGIAAEPDLAFAHYALARVLSDRHRDAEAASAIAEAIRLEPTDADYHGMSAGIELARRNWSAALEAATTGLQFNPEHVHCNNLRAMALVKLGRKAEADQTLTSTLAREPENALSHANKAWTLLEAGDRRKAMEHFRESLRLDPSNEWARAGLVEAIKAGNPVYAVMLRYFLWMQRLSSGARWGIILGGYFGSRFLSSLGEGNPALKPFVMPVLIAYMTFAILTWLAHPVFNLLLFLHPYGRHALNTEQRSQASWVGLCLALGIASLALWFVSGRYTAYLIPALVFGLLCLPVSAIHSCHQGWPRLAMIALTLTLAVAGLVAVGVLTFLEPPARSDMAALGHSALGFFSLGIFVSQWVAIWLSQQRPAR